MSEFNSREALKYAHDVREAIEYVNIPAEKAVLVSSGAVYLGAKAVDVSCRFPADIDISCSPEYLDTLAYSLPDAARLPAENGYFYRGRVGDWQVDIGSTYGSLSHDQLQAGAQLTPDGTTMVASLNHVKEYKRQRDLPKDREDIEFIDSLLKRFELQPQVEGSSKLACTAEAMFGNTDASYQASLLLSPSRYAPLDPTEREIIDALGIEGLERMGVRYGTGAPDFRFTQIDPEKNRKILLYNTMRHEHEVGDDGYTLGAQLGLGERACYGFWLGGRWHDENQDGVIVDPTNRDGRDELYSAQELIEEARMRGVPKDIAMWAAYFILGTQVVTDGSAVKGQAVAFLPQEAFPSNEAFLAAKIGASADLGRLYNGDYTVSLGLLPQRRGYDDPHMFDLSNSHNRELAHKFFIGQRGFLGGHHYPLAEAEELFGSEYNRAEKMWITDQLIAISANDELPTTWQDLGELVRMLEYRFRVR
jgi:hypothetical protein